MRYIIVDYMHLAYKCMNTPQLSTLIQLPSGAVEVDTTVPNFTIKDIFRYSEKGLYPIAVCLEGGCPTRAEHFKKVAADPSKAGQYKGNRDNRNKSPLFEGCDLAVNILHNGGVSLYRQIGCEADDLVYNLIQEIKKVDTEVPIDVITNDGDLLPLVDDQVSVYKRSNTLTYADPGSPQLKGYFQVTPYSWDDFMSRSSEFRNFYIPYNSLLLYKLIRGDKSDNIGPSVKGYGGVKYSALIEQMLVDGVDLNIFNYHTDRQAMANVLSNYFTPEQVERMLYIHEGVNFIKVEGLNLPRMIDIVKLQNSLSNYRIKLPLY